MAKYTYLPTYPYEVMYDSFITNIQADNNEELFS